MAQIHYCCIYQNNKSLFEEPSNQVTYRMDVKSSLGRGSISRQKGERGRILLGDRILVYEHFISGIDNEFTIFVIAESSTMCSVILDGFILEMSKIFQLFVKEKRDRKYLNFQMRELRLLYNHPPETPDEKQKKQLHPFIRTQQSVRKVKIQVLDAIDSALERGEKLETLQYCVEELSHQSLSFKKKSKCLKNNFTMGLV